MKVALVHDYIKEFGGAERVLETLHEIWPEASFYTTVYLPKFLGPHRPRFEKWDIRTSWLQKIPFKAKLISPFRLIAPFIFKSWNFDKHDVVIVSATGAYNPNLIKKGKAVHICYCHTPPRYLYGYPTARNWKSNIFFKIFGGLANHILRMADFHSAQNVDWFIANSKEVKARIKKFYRKDAVVIYPPVDIHNISQRSPAKRDPALREKTKNQKSYFLAGGRLARAKRVDLAIRACTKLKLPLKIFGKEFAGYGEELREIAGKNVEFLGEVSEEEKWQLMAGAKAFIFPSEIEDFGITPVEAMAEGTPVIAYRSGGVKETVLEGKTGLFFNELTVSSLVSAIKQFNRLTIKPINCVKQAKKFSKERFIKQIKEVVKKHAGTT